jgi:transcriptional antiterminator NusG
MSDIDTDTNQSQIEAIEAADAEESREAATDVAAAEADDVAGDADELAETPDEAVATPADELADAGDFELTDDAEQVADTDQAADAAADGQAQVEPAAETEATDVVSVDAAESEATDVVSVDAAESEATDVVSVDAAETEAAPAGGDVTEAEPNGEVMTEQELLEQARVESPYDRPGRWFVVHTQSGYEKKVKQNLEARIVSMNAEDAIYEVVIPMEDYVDFRNGKRIVAQRKMFPGYLLVRAELDDQAWFVIRNTPGVTGFVGQGAKPSPLPRRDVESFLMPKGGTEEQAAQRAKPRLEYEIGETVRVKEGPFADFSGEVIELNEDQLKLKVLVNIFGRETPVELEFSKVAKL